MSRPNRKRVDEAVQTAGMILKLAKNGQGMTAQSALRHAGVSTEDRANRNLHKRVHRAKSKLDNQKKQLLDDFESMELDSEAEKVFPFPDSQESVIPIVPTAPKMMKMRRTSHQATGQRKVNIQTRDLKAKLFQEACEAVQQENEKEQRLKAEGKAYKKKSAEVICGEINAQPLAQVHGIKLIGRSVRNAVLENRVVLKKRGEPGKLPEEYFKALCDAVKSYSLLSVEDGKKVTNLRPKLTKMVNACVNKLEGESSRQGRKLFDRVQAELAGELNVGKPNRIEQRRQQYATYANINQWYSNLQQFFIDQGFAKLIDDELVFHQFVLLLILLLII
ncbi:unknown protein [Seminavis robusta]|uniref:Uncharacterized protein n=1 Tax=Seminavis robusta TaxID=568900 RepID=A0A9N8EC92_9STRA|nr:unknown protein [Seminavis robusta]|eukprot:Sro795_g203600.1 n/a (334) ;mRNA; r:38732-40312